MATIQEQLENAVAIYNKCANRVNQFINGADNETVESETGNKPTIAKIIKDTQDSVEAVKDRINQKALEVSNNKQEVEELVANVERIHDQSEVPVGSIMLYPRFNLPNGFLECNGSTVQASTYPQLVKYLTGDDNATQAVLPDLRGEFVRGWDNGRGIDLHRILGSLQMDQLQGHHHIVKNAASWGTAHYGPASSSKLAQGRDSHASYRTNYGVHEAISDGSNGTPRLGFETRPRNVSMVYAIRAFGTFINVGDVDLKGMHQELQNLKTSRIVTDDTNLFDNYCKYSWFGKISSNGGEILESDLPLKAHGAWSLGNPVFNKEDRTWNLASGLDRIGVAYRKGTIPADTYVKMEWTMRFKCTSFGTSNTSIMSMSYPNQDFENVLFRIENSTKKLKLWASEKDATWSLASGSLFNKIYELNTIYDLRISYDVSFGKIKVEWSDDELEYDDENKVWNLDREISFGIAKRAFIRQPNGVTIVGFGTDSHEYDSTANIPPQVIYADYCSFKLDGVELAKQSIKSGFCFGQSKEFHQIVGYKDNQLISEFCHNADGSDAVNINGDLAVVFSGFNYNNGLTYDYVRYTDEENIRYYKVSPKFTVSKTTSKTGATYNLLHYAPKNAYSFNAYFYTNGGYNYVRDVNEDNSVFYGYKEQSVSWANQTDRKISDIKLSDKTGKIWIDRRSYDDNEVGLYNQGHSLRRGVKQ